MNFSISFEHLLNLFPEAEISATNETRFHGIAALERAISGDISFLGNSKYKSLVSKSNASVILLPKSYDELPQSGFFKS